MILFSKKNEEKKIRATSNGKIKTLKSLKDGVFSEKMMGDGVVISPSVKKGKYVVYSPTNGKLITVFPTGHAYGIQTKDGVEILIHIGIDTVNLDGKGFDPVVKQGQKIKVGDKLVEIDLDIINANAPSSDIIIIITSGQKIIDVAKGEVTKGDIIFGVE